MTTASKKEALLTISQAAEYLNVTKATIRRWTNDGSLSCLRVGARKERRFLESELQKLISGPEVEPDRSTTNNEAGGAHHCVVCDDSEHEWQAIANAVIRHLSDHSQVVFVGDSERIKRLAKIVADQGMDPETLASAGALRLLSVEESYLLTGLFSATRAIAFVESTILDAFAKGFERLLFVGNVDWVFHSDTPDDGTLVTQVMEYEKQLNGMLGKYPTVTILCPYVLSRIDSKTIVSAFLAHPKLQLKTHVIAGLYSGEQGENSLSVGC